MSSSANPDIDGSATTPAIPFVTPRRVAMLVGLVALIPYLLTLNHTFGFIDKGELVAVATTLGISHPTGYPTIMMLGNLFTKIMPMRPVLALNVMAALLVAAGAGCMTLLFDDLLRRLTARTKKSSAQKKQTGKKKAGKQRKAPVEEAVTSFLDPSIRSLYAGLGALMVAFTAMWWDQGNSFEVYSLHTLMMPLVMLLFLRYIDEEAARDGKILPGSSVTEAPSSKIGFTRRGAWFAFALGFSFSNHLTTILLAPAFLVYFFWMVGSSSNFRAFVRWFYLAPFFILGLLPYIYLPIRASMHPTFNWGDPETLKNFIDHVTGKLYRVWMFDSMEIYRQQTSYFFNNLPDQFAYVGLALAAVGIVHVMMRNLRLGVLTALMFIGCIVYSGGFSISEIEPYYLTAILSVGIWCLAGVHWLHERFGSTLTLAGAAVLVIAICGLNYTESDESNNWMVEDMTINVLTPMPKNALIISQQWDFWTAGSFYMQAVEHLRPDVIVVDPELMRRSWYLDQLEHNYPDFMRPIKPQVDLFRSEVHKFEYDLPYDPADIQHAYVGMIRTMIDSALPKRSVHVTEEVDPTFIEGYTHIPYYMTLRLSHDTTYQPQEFPTFKFRFWEKHVSQYEAKMCELYARTQYARALYERHWGHNDLARRYADYIFTFDPGYTMNNIPDLPLNNEDQITHMIDYFDQLRRDLAPLRGGAKGN